MAQVGSVIRWSKCNEHTLPRVPESQSCLRPTVSRERLDTASKGSLHPYHLLQLFWASYSTLQSRSIWSSTDLFDERLMPASAARDSLDVINGH